VVLGEHESPQPLPDANGVVIVRCWRLSHWELSHWGLSH
jgi:hypothetical protein